MSDRTSSQDFDDRSIDIDREQERQIADLFQRTVPRPTSLDFESLESESVSFFRRIPMTVRITVPLAAVVLLVACVLMWQPAQVDANMTFAEVQQRLEQVKTITFRQRSFSFGLPSEKTEKGAEAEKVMLLAPSTIRVEMANGSYAVNDFKQGRQMLVDPEKKRVVRFENVANITDELKQMNFYEFIRNMQEEAAQELPGKEIDGKQYPGFLVEREVSHPALKKKETIQLKVWVDPQSKLPVRIEELYPDPKVSGGYRLGGIMDQFVFDKPLDPGLFSFNPPEGFVVEAYGVEQLSPPDENDELQKPVLTPKVGLGPVKFGMLQEEVMKVFGKPEKVVPAGDRGASLEYYSRGVGMFVSDVLGVATISVTSQRFTAVRVRPFAGKTDKGIHLGSSEEDVRRAYGEPSRVEDRTKESGPKTLYYDGLNGWFSLWQGKVDSMFFSIPRETKLKIMEQRKKDESKESKD